MATRITLVNWNGYWNWRFNDLYSLGQTEESKTYRGPSGPEFIRYIIENRRTNGLPEICVEDRNRHKVNGLLP